MSTNRSPFFHVVLHEELMSGDTLPLMELKREIIMRGIAVIVFEVDKRVFTNGSARKAEAIYIHRLLSVWPSFFRYCSPELAAQLKDLLREPISAMH